MGFVGRLSQDRPCLFSYGAVFGNQGKRGHTVFVAGYAMTDTASYLRVADGWNFYLRYINYNGYNYLRRNGWAFRITE